MARNLFPPTRHRGAAASALLLLTLGPGISQGAPGHTELVSVALDGSAAGFADQSQTAGPAVSADGRYVAFVSGATNLVTNDTNGFSDTFVRDRLNGTVERMERRDGREPRQWLQRISCDQPRWALRRVHLGSLEPRGGRYQRRSRHIRARSADRPDTARERQFWRRAGESNQSDGGNELGAMGASWRSCPSPQTWCRTTPTITPTYSCGIGRPAQLSA